MAFCGSVGGKMKGELFVFCRWTTKPSPQLSTVVPLIPAMEKGGSSPLFLAPSCKGYRRRIYLHGGRHHSSKYLTSVGGEIKTSSATLNTSDNFLLHGKKGRRRGGGGIRRLYFLFPARNLERLVVPLSVVRNVHRYNYWINNR